MLLCDFMPPGPALNVYAGLSATPVIKLLRNQVTVALHLRSDQEFPQILQV